MSHTRSNGQGFSGRTAGQFNKTDTRIITREFTVSASATASQIDTGIKLSNTVQVISAFVKVGTAEATGTTKTLSVGLFGGTAAEFLSASVVSAVGVVGTPLLVAKDSSTFNTIGYKFGSADFAELECTVVLTLLIGD